MNKLEEITVDLWQHQNSYNHYKIALESVHETEEFLLEQLNKEIKAMNDLQFLREHIEYV